MKYANYIVSMKIKEAFTKEFSKAFNGTLIKRACLVLVLFAAVVMIEPYCRDALTFGFTLFDNSADYSQQVISQQPIQTEVNSENLNSQRTGRAPEPSTFVLFLGGIASFIATFVRKSYQRLKRLMDILLAIFGLILTAPLIMLASLLIKFTSKGPVIYLQNRLGKYGEIFKIYKFRTMRVDAEDKTGAVWAKANDPRVTSVGKILRKTHVDEIPQLINVLKGEMSIVGPRPERPELVRDLKKMIVDYEKRLKVKPGITGLAQVWHKYDESIQDVKKKIKYDLLYIRKLCLWVDLRIIAQTFIVILTGKGAR
ncbi:MAG: exopolysaccharide biosynthesis polyprenyl glycosylphosphotransferase [Candidatus Omnitrophota bacterium]